ncbi:MAG TPA: protoporphyrinogen oxidase [Thermodesulfobacteriota bacterium]|nr:protoporphyrinogen oxidase [Thermodesulfobacteriota bacterium]
MRIIVIGGGITGLSAAHHLVELHLQKNLPLEPILLEGSGRLGGAITTRHTDGFLMEEGPDSYITTKPWALSLCRRIGLEPKLIPTNYACRRTFVVHRGRLLPIPDGFFMLAPTQFFPFVRSPLFSWRGKLRMALDLVLPRAPRQDDESLASFVSRRLGREALERVAQPLISGIYTADPEKLSLRATIPSFLEMEEKHGSIIKAMLLEQRRSKRRQSEDFVRSSSESLGQNKESGARYGIFVSFKEGMQTLVDALLARLTEDEVFRPQHSLSSSVFQKEIKRTGNGNKTVQLNQRVKHVVRSFDFAQGSPQAGMANGGWRVFMEDGTWLDTDGIIIATPAYQTAALVERLDKSLASDLRKIEYASSVVINLAYRGEDISHPLDGFGFVVPMVEKLTIIACSFSSVKFAGRAPEGSVLLRCFVGGAINPEAYELENSELINAAHKEISSLLGIKAQPLFALVHRHPQSMPQYPVGHLEHIAQINAKVSKYRGLAFAGNAYNGVGIPDCIRSGEAAAESILTINK